MMKCSLTTGYIRTKVIWSAFPAEIMGSLHFMRIWEESTAEHMCFCRENGIEGCNIEKKLGAAIGGVLSLFSWKEGTFSC